MKKKLSPAVLHGVIAAVVIVVVAVAGYLFLIGPQRSKASSLERQINDTQAQIERNRLLSAGEGHNKPLRVAGIYRLTRAVPDSVGMPDMILELDHTAAASGINFQAITPGAAVQLNGYQVLPIDVEFIGNFYDLSKFLYRLRNLVHVRHGKLDATGRLFTVDKLSFAEGEKKFPQIDAHLTVDAFVFGGTVAPPTPASSVTDLSSTTSSTSPTPSLPATTAQAPPITPPNGATAAGATP